MSEQGEAYLNLFLFTVGGVHFAVDAEQAVGMVPYAGEEAADLFWAHEELGFVNVPASCQSPTIVTIRTKGAQSYRVIIDAMEDIAEFDRNDIKLFPELLEAAALRNGMWGVLPRDGYMVLLVDFQRLIQEKRSHFSDTRQGG